MHLTFKVTFLLLTLCVILCMLGLGCNNDAADTKPVPKPDNSKVQETGNSGSTTIPKTHD